MLEAIAAVLVVAAATGVGTVRRIQREGNAGLSSSVGAPGAADPGEGAVATLEAPTPPADDPLTRMLVALKGRPWMRRGMSLLSFVLLGGAVAMLGYPVWTNFEASRQQDRLERQLASPELRQAYLEGRVGDGDSLTRIRIPKIDVAVVVVEGTSASALRAGAGHYPSSVLPCEIGNVAIAGHRTTYGRPFHNLDLLKPGDTVVLETPVGSCTYVVDQDPYVVSPDDTSVIQATPNEGWLTLTTCHPKGSARQRLIVRARLVPAATSST